MKKNYFFTLLLTLCFSAITFGQGLEPFTNSNATSAYADDSFVGEGGITWTYVASRDDDGTAGVTAPALMLRRVSDDSKITSSTISGGIGDFSVKLYKGFTGGGNRQVELFVNGVSRGTSVPFDDFDEHVFTVSGINVTGNVVIEIKNTTSKQVIIDDISWTAPSSDPTIAITNPSDNQVFPGSTTEVPIILSVSNFILSGDNGSELSDNTGDGYIKGTLQASGEAPGTKNIFTTTPEPATVEAGKSYTITAELVDNSGASLSPKVEAIISFSVDFPCDIVLDNYVSTCVTETAGVDTYDISIPFTGGNTSTYTLTADSGTIGGDDPSTNASGTITITGVTEGTDVVFTLKGDVANSNCDLTRNISSPTCIAFPVIEDFDYDDGAILGAQPAWTTLNSGDDMLVATGNLDYTGLKASTGRLLEFDESGSETYTSFKDVSSGTVYASFLLKVTAFQTNASPDLTDGGYIASLAGSTSGYDARFWVRPNPGTGTGETTFDIGYGTESSNPTFTSGTYELNEVIFVVMAYDMDNAMVSTWINPAAASFEGTIPAATLSSTDSNPPSAINLFVLRQDSDQETPFVQIDALRISNSWAEVTPKDVVASVDRNAIDGFATYPNPITDKRFTISSNSTNVKQVAIFNVLGKKVFTSTFSGNTKNVDIAGINSGIYILKVTENGKTATKKLVIK
ncbi:T9SS type A sorting domain-containing protein [Polaribacter pectinis]|uniref:T9SS type A sorting domain-containing protein n=1 Tax=Polaribacter pectinis TaxID=2738844 RepID=A0A7G9L995_9FLAO|nr:T9SS type A sorting domain-containing protein [Polaribacter pectinis]QNM85194.1 T9SS type A sorting domain-containing protein [Polaribacter pectinis]